MNSDVFLMAAVLIALGIFLREGYMMAIYSIQSYHDNLLFFNHSLAIPTAIQQIKQNAYVNSTVLSSLQQSPSTNVSSNAIHHPASIRDDTIKSSFKQSSNSTSRKRLNAFEKGLLQKEKLRDALTLEIERQQNRTVDAETKFVVFMPVESGFGNSIAVLIETLLFAFFTDRHFLSIISITI